MAKSNKTNSNYPEGLVQALIELPHAETVYISGNVWHFIKQDGFTAVSREEILGSFEPAQTEEV
jgi:hypothetical protein